MRERECCERDVLCNAEQLGDDELIASLKHCVAHERAVTARLLVHFGEVDARGLFRDQGYDSMFAYAVIGLHMSEAEAMMRIRVSRLGRAFPVALQMLARGEVHLTSLKLLAPVLTRDNLVLLTEARFKSKQQVLELLAKHFPKPDAATSMRRLPARVTDAVATPGANLPLTAASAALPNMDVAVIVESCGGVRSAEHLAMESSPHFVPGVDPSSRVAVDANAVHGAAEAKVSSAGSDGTVFLPARQTRAFCLTPPSAAVVAPLSPGRYKIQFTADERVRDKLKLAQDLLRHQVPGGDVAVIVERALDLLIASRKRQLFAETDKPRQARRDAEVHRNPEVQRRAEAHRAHDDARVAGSRAEPPSASRHIPHAVRREVVARDALQCCFVGPDGARCPARGGLEFHHQVPYARGGPAAPENVQLLCRAHNGLMAERDFGKGFMRVQRGQCT